MTNRVIKMDLIKIIRKIYLSVLKLNSVQQKNVPHYFISSETLHSYQRATSFEHLALNQFYNVNQHQMCEKTGVYQRNAMWNFLHAALKGYSSAQYKLGMSYLHGQLGLVANAEKATKWLLLAANQGHSDAQQQLEHLYLQ